MKMLYKYIFYKVHSVTSLVSEEKEFPWAYPSIIVSVYFSMTIYDILSIIEYFFVPHLTNIHFGYVALAILMAISLYTARNQRYKKIFHYGQNLPLKTRRLLLVATIAYSLILLLGFFGMSELIRARNLIN
jgi:hypothetical protein